MNTKYNYDAIDRELSLLDEGLFDNIKKRFQKLKGAKPASNTAFSKLDRGDEGTTATDNWIDQQASSRLKKYDVLKAKKDKAEKKAAIAMAKNREAEKRLPALEPEQQSPADIAKLKEPTDLSIKDTPKTKILPRADLSEVPAIKKIVDRLTPEQKAAKVSGQEIAKKISIPAPNIAKPAPLPLSVPLEPQKVAAIPAPLAAPVDTKIADPTNLALPKDFFSRGSKKEPLSVPKIEPASFPGPAPIAAPKALMAPPKPKVKTPQQIALDKINAQAKMTASKVRTPAPDITKAGVFPALNTQQPVDYLAKLRNKVLKKQESLSIDEQLQLLNEDFADILKKNWQSAFQKKDRSFIDKLYGTNDRRGINAGNFAGSPANLEIDSDIPDYQEFDRSYGKTKKSKDELNRSDLALTPQEQDSDDDTINISTAYDPPTGMSQSKWKKDFEAKQKKLKEQERLDQILQAQEKFAHLKQFSPELYKSSVANEVQAREKFAHLKKSDPETYKKAVEKEVASKLEKPSVKTGDELKQFLKSKAAEPEDSAVLFSKYMRKSEGLPIDYFDYNDVDKINPEVKKSSMFGHSGLSANSDAWLHGKKASVINAMAPMVKRKTLAGSDLGSAIDKQITKKSGPENFIKNKKQIRQVAKKASLTEPITFQNRLPDAKLAIDPSIGDNIRDQAIKKQKMLQNKKLGVEESMKNRLTEFEILKENINKFVSVYENKPNHYDIENEYPEDLDELDKDFLGRPIKKKDSVPETEDMLISKDKMKCAKKPMIKGKPVLVDRE